MRISDWSSDVCSSDLLPLGGLIETPFVTAHLDPVEAQRLDSQVQEAIEQTIDDWICQHRLYDRPRDRREIDHAKADQDTRAVLARWVAAQSLITATDTPSAQSTKHAQHYRSSDTNRNPTTM